MEGTIKRLLLAATLLMALAPLALAASTPNLAPFLRAELTEINLLNAQVTYLQQHGDQLGASLVASYIPDHQMQANMLISTMSTLGQNPANVHASSARPFTGSQKSIVNHDISTHRRVASDYRGLLKRTNDVTITQLALNGINGAERHLNSLYIARATVDPSSHNTRIGLEAALRLERAVVGDLQVQAGQLRMLGDTANSNLLLASIPAHQQQIAQLESLVMQAGGNPARVVPPLAVPLPTQSAILTHERVMGIQMANTYAVPIAALPNSPYRQFLMLAQQNYLVMLAQLPQVAV